MSKIQIKKKLLIMEFMLLIGKNKFFHIEFCFLNNFTLLCVSAFSKNFRKLSPKLAEKIVILVQ
jgi:hypothetical protein